MSVEQEARAVRLDHLLGVYRVGSRDWSWRDEYDDLIHRPVTQQLLAAVKRDGITEPILLGTDGRVWDGHHRIAVAMHLGLDSVPVEFAGASRSASPATRETVTEEMVEAAARVLHPAGLGPWDETKKVWRERTLMLARAALEAALADRPSRPQQTDPHPPLWMGQR